MAQKIAIALLHGFRSQTEQFANDVHRELMDRCIPQIGTDIVLRVVDWADVLSNTEKQLLQRLSAVETLYYPQMRTFITEWIADALAYQQMPHDRRLYDCIHELFAQTMRDLARAAGENAPLCIIAHGLGSVIASNYIYDLQNAHKGLIAPNVLAQIADTPMERGETLSLFYTISSPIALWNMRYPNFGTPIAFPHPALPDHYRNLPTEWINFYDPQDVFGYPLKALNAAHWETVTEDRPINTGRVIDHLTPQSQRQYGTAKTILQPIADKVIEVWRSANQVHAAR